MPSQNLKLAIMDDAFPYMNTGFRIAEFNWLIKNENAHVFSTSPTMKHIQLSSYKRFYPSYVSNIHTLDQITLPQYNDLNLVYIVFLCNMPTYIDVIHQINKPFVVGAYNSEFQIANNPDTDLQFSRFLNDPLCKGVIVCQKFWYDYILSKNFCPASKIHFIYGGLSHVSPSSLPKLKYKKDKATFDLCFTAYLHNASFIHTKGYDFFIDTAKILYNKNKNIHFHVIGGATQKTLDVKTLGDNIHFYGALNMNQLAEVYRKSDIILSATSPTHIAVNSNIQTTADGFPTISTVDAALCGVFPIVTDPLSCNSVFINNHDISIIPLNSQLAAAKIMRYFNSPDHLYRLAEASKKKFQSVFNTDLQMQQRIQIFQAAIQ